MITARLEAFAARRRAISFWRGLGEALSLLCAGVLLVAAMWTWFQPPFQARAAATASLYLLSLATLWRRGIGPALRAATAVETARQLEEATGGRLEERLLSAVELARQHPPGTSAWMARQIIVRAAEEVASLHPERWVDTRPAAVAWQRALAGLALVSVPLALGVPGFRLALDPFAADILPTAPTLAVAPGDCQVHPGEALAITAAVQPPPERVTLRVRWQDGFKEALTMTRTAGTNGFAQQIGDIRQDFRYRVETGATRSPEFRVTVAAPPRFERLQLLVTPPAYAHWPTTTLEGGDAELLAGSRVRLLVDLGGAAAQSVELLTSGAPPQFMTVRTNRASLELAPTTNLTYSLRLSGRDGLTAAPPDQWTLQVFPDAPPTATLSGAGLDAGAVGPGEVVLLEAGAQDDVGLKSLDLVMTSNGTNVSRQPLAWKPQPVPDGHGQMAQTTTTLNLEEHNLNLGDEVELRTRVTDLAGQAAWSEPLRLSLLEPQQAAAVRLAAVLRQRLAATEAALESFDQAQRHWLTWLHNYGAEPQSGLAEAGLVVQHLGQVRDALVTLGTNLFTDAGQAATPLGPYLNGLAGAFPAWGEAQCRILGAAVGQVVDAPAERVDAAVAQSRDLFAHAAGELGQLRARLAVAPVALESDVMLARAELAQGRIKRGLPVLRAALKWDNDLQNGLLASFFAGRELQPPLVLQQIALPSFDNYEVPKLGGENWSVRYQGELQVPAAANWRFSCQADDGVRLFLDGRNVFPSEAWAAEGSRERVGTAQLTAGWHAMTLEFFQATGANQLHVRWGREGEVPSDLTLTNLRARLPRDPGGATDLTGLTPEALRSATNRLFRSLGAVARVSTDLATLTNDVPLRELIKLAESETLVGPQINTNLSRFNEWTGADASATETETDELTTAAREARRVLFDQLGQGRARWRGAPGLQAARLPVEELRQTLTEMRPAAWQTKNRAELVAQHAPAFAAAKAWNAELRRGTHALAQALFAEAQRPGAGLAERAQDLKASLRLQQAVGQATQIIQEALETAPTAKELLQRVDKQMDRIDNTFTEVVRASETQTKAAVAQLARDGLRQLRASDTAAVRQTTVPTILAVEHREGEQSLADALEQAAAQATPTNLIQRLHSLVLRAWEPAVSLADTIPPPMYDGVRQLDEAPQAQVATAEFLAQPRLALAVEAERLRRQGDRKTAVAYAQLGQDLGRLLLPAEQLRPDTLTPLADRAAALAGLRGAQAREAEINAAAERHPPPPPAAGPDTAKPLAERLDELAEEASQAAADRAKRPTLDSGLEEMAAPSQPGTDEQTIARDAATAAEDDIKAAPQRGQSYHDASRELASGAAELRLRQAAQQAAAAQAAAQRAAETAAQAAARLASHARPPSFRLHAQEGDFLRPVGTAAGLDREVSGPTEADWAKVREQLRTAAGGGGIETFSEEEQAAIRAYFKRLADAP